ncbi:ankyrin repeat domain-containing protein [Fluoribacter gormanii]|uniref:Ankyrin repeat n=1 Tax=Fluoribacter gormanii TaxID=464 RepID=A0A377GI13_9GAMM|nr:ankyrin repeat domain-containing protein [Fluoribacter gormanii]KTD03251.1 ankyrin repeat-containing protein [Fluoribacter gormanii]MCW8444276.1 ankyrin repeat domain-containing protein [Fluoribacter gormanii]SIR71936.1 Ankyrin repeat [Fluoribacter gormanii]STO24203.1 Ribulose-5-phosphate 4-epimerase and related epimerases and aldolases [Fluoribacter gormanii]
MGREELFKAAIKQGNLVQFAKLMSSVYEENFLMTDENGNTLAHLAAIYDQPEILKVLIRKAEELDSSIFEITNSNGFTPLECCYLHSSLKAMLLLESNSQLSSSTNLIVSKQYDRLKGLPPSGLHRKGLEKIALVASALGDVTAMQILLNITRNKENLLRYQTKDGWSGVHFAASNDRLDIIKLFPEEFAAKVTDNDGNTPLMVAAGRGNLNIIEYLLEKGADLHQSNNHGESAVIFAVENGQLNTLKFLDEKGVDLTIVNNKGENPLLVAAKNGHLACVSYLLDRGFSADLKDNQGKTAFQLALETSQLEIADLLVAGSTSNEKDHALIDAVNRGDLAAVQWLVEHGASLAAMDTFQMTPLLLAAHMGNIKLVDYFLSLDPSPVHDKDSEGDNILFVAIKSRHTSLVEHLVTEGLFSLEERNSQGKTPLLVAAEINSEELVELLHQKGSSLEEEDEEGNTAFHLLLAKEYLGNAMSYIYTQSPDLLLKKNHKGESPIHTAIRHKHSYEIERILGLVSLEPEKRTELLELRDAQGNTALLSAVESHNFEAIPILRKAEADLLAKNDKGQSVITITPLNTFPQETLKLFFDAYHLDYREYYARRRLYFIFGGEKLNEALKFPNADVKFGSGLFDEGVRILDGYLNDFIRDKHPEYASQFKPLLAALDKLQSDTTVEDILNQLNSEEMVFQATGFTGHGVLATLKNMSGEHMKLSLAERGARVGGAPFLNDESKKFAAVRSIIVPKEKRQQVIELLYQAKNSPQAEGVDILFKQIPEFVGEPYQFSSIYQKKFMDICFYSNPKTGLYEQFIEILGDEKGRAFYKEFELYMREQELEHYKELHKLTHPGESLQENPIIVEAEELIENRQEAIHTSLTHLK